jgi:ribosomal protein S18 acetylase RimI-like enzyme
VLLGCLTLNLMQPEAALPPPWPSAAPWRPYLGNMAVAPAARRRGVAAALLAAAERLGERPGGGGGGVC